MEKIGWLVLSISMRKQQLKDFHFYVSHIPNALTTLFCIPSICFYVLSHIFKWPLEKRRSMGQAKKIVPRPPPVPYSRRPVLDREPTRFLLRPWMIEPRHVETVDQEYLLALYAASQSPTVIRAVCLTTGSRGLYLELYMWFSCFLLVRVCVCA
ncbi:hypothetical protein NC651_025094 [Populus alba x Populus x berolinensis]|nr:hypothetical protein NC651_025094 [Populus alba x Populus x berolinensis]